MQVLKNEWTGLFNDLSEKLNGRGRRILLSRMIGEVQSIAVGTFGEGGTNRPTLWPSLKRSYADEWHEGNTNPTLLLSDEKHYLKNPSDPHLIDSFSISLSSEQASLTNVSPYADAHQLGLVIPARPYYPIDEAGNLTPYAESRVFQAVENYFQSPKF